MSALQSWFNIHDQHLILPFRPNKLKLPSCRQSWKRNLYLINPNRLHLQTRLRGRPHQEMITLGDCPLLFSLKRPGTREEPSFYQITKTTLRKPWIGKMAAETSPEVVEPTICCLSSHHGRLAQSPPHSSWNKPSCSYLYHWNHTECLSTGKLEIWQESTSTSFKIIFPRQRPFPISHSWQLNFNRNKCFWGRKTLRILKTTGQGRNTDNRSKSNKQNQTTTRSTTTQKQPCFMKKDCKSS